MPFPFTRHGPALPAFPVVIAVPHAGRDYPPALIADALVQPAQLRLLEDRFADRLIEGALALGATAVVADRARAWIDLNRDPRDIDPAMIAGPPPAGLMTTARARGGLGLIPHRMGNDNALWRRKLSTDEIAERVAQYHRPYHQAIAAALATARARFGNAILLDCHSMPPIRSDRDIPRPQLVIGDRFGRSAGSAFADRVEMVARQQGLVVARNAPYAGGYSLDLHGRPGQAIHALQIELDRSLYLDAALDAPGSGMARTSAIVTAIFEALAEEVRAIPLTIAAE